MSKPIILALALAALPVSPALPAAPALQFSLSANQGFHYASTVQTPVGFITSMTVGTTALKSDLIIAGPANAPKSAVAVMTSCSWDGGPTEVLSVAGDLSTENKQQLAVLLHMAGTSTVQITYVILAYDPFAKSYYTASSGTALIGSPATATSLTIAATPGPVPSPQNWEFQVALKPAAKAQTITNASSAKASFVLPWGIAAK